MPSTTHEMRMKPSQSVGEGVKPRATEIMVKFVWAENNQYFTVDVFFS